MATAKGTGVQEPVCGASMLDQTLSESSANDLAHAFRALGDPVRLRVFNLIANAGEVCACDLLQPIGRSQPTVSHHTKALSEAGLITGEKRGRWVWWSIVPDRVAALGSALASGRDGVVSGPAVHDVWTGSPGRT